VPILCNGPALYFWKLPLSQIPSGPHTWFL